MKAPNVPTDEAVRLHTLNSLNILDTSSEERFDRLTRMAKRLFGVPIALVSLVDENRQWFKSCIGLPVTETSREISFCGHAILGDDVFLIPDTLDDERFADNPLVVDEPHIRFYAGAPLKALNGQKMGTLCIIDQEPRKVDREDLEVLEDLAAMVERELAAVQLAIQDELTGISNRRGFMELAQYSLKLCQRQSLPATLIFIDLDEFKQVNDVYGHAAGDRALRLFAGYLSSACRDSDLVARLGGDEFVILLVNTDQLQGEQVISRLLQSIEQENKKIPCEYNMAFSHGVVEFDHERDVSVDDLLSKGDEVMYTIKKAKRD